MISDDDLPMNKWIVNGNNYGSMVRKLEITSPTKINTHGDSQFATCNQKVVDVSSLRGDAPKIADFVP